MKKCLCILVLLFFIGIASFAQNASISTTHSNIKHGVIATYTAAGGLVLSFKQNLMDSADKKAFASGKFIVYENQTLTRAECQALHISSGFIIKGSGPINNTRDGLMCQAGVCLKIGGAEHKNDWPQK